MPWFYLYAQTSAAPILKECAEKPHMDWQGPFGSEITARDSADADLSQSINVLRRARYALRTGYIA